MFHQLHQWGEITLFISHITTGVKNTIHNETILAVGVNRFLTNVSRTQMSIVNRSSTVDNINNQEEMSVLDYDNLSNRVTRF